MKRYIFSLLFLSSLIVGLSLCLGVDEALSIPLGQRDCDNTFVSTFSSTFTIVPDTRVAVNNGDISRNCIITFSTEVFTSLGDVTELRYTIDSTNPANCQNIGPLTFHTGVGGWEAVTQMGVKNIGASTHTIRPCFSAVDSNNEEGAGVTFYGRCLVVECRTQ